MSHTFSLAPSVGPFSSERNLSWIFEDLVFVCAALVRFICQHSRNPLLPIFVRQVVDTGHYGTPPKPFLHLELGDVVSSPTPLAKIPLLLNGSTDAQGFTSFGCCPTFAAKTTFPTPPITPWAVP